MSGRNSPVAGGSASTGPVPSAAAHATFGSAGPSASASAFVKSGTGYILQVKPETIPKLTGASTWKTWSTLFIQYLRTMGAENLVNPSLTKPAAGDADEADWYRADAAVTMILLTTIDPSLHHLINHETDSAAEIFAKLKANYSATTTLSSFLKFKQYFFSSLDGTRPLAEQLEERGRLWKEVNDSGILDSKELLKIFGLLSVIPDSFANIVEPILAVTAPKDLSFDDIRSRLLDEASRKDSSASVSAVTAAPRARKSASKKKSGKHCDWCNYDGHVESECRKKAAQKVEAQSRKGKGKESSGAPSSTGSAAVHAVSVEDSASETTNATVFFYAGTKPWMLDSGCTKHMSNNINDFTEYKAFDTPRIAKLADSSTTLATLGSGRVVGTTQIDGKALTVQFDNVLYCPSIACPTISVSCLDAKGFSVVFSDNGARITKDNRTVGIGHLKGGQYWFGLAVQASSVASSTHVDSAPIDLAHQRFGHLNWEALQQLHAENPPVKGLKLNESKRSPHPCEGCVMGKMHRTTFPSSSTSRAEHPFDLVHTDLAGPMQADSVVGGHKFWLTFIDDFSDTLWIYFLRHKSEQESKFDEFRAMVKNQYGRDIKVLRSDRGGEYQSKSFIAKLKSLGIVHQRTNPDTPQQNGKAERYNRTIVEAAKSLLHAAGMSYGFWEEAVKTAVHVRNRAPKKALDWRTSIEVLTGEKPDVSYFRVFGCLAYRQIHKDHRRKLEPNAQSLVFVGYEAGSKGYRLWNRHTHKIVSSIDVIFDELVFPFLVPPSSSSSNTTNPPSTQASFDFIPLHTPSSEPATTTPQVPPTQPSPPSGAPSTTTALWDSSICS